MPDAGRKDLGMKLDEVFPGSGLGLKLLQEKANAYDDPVIFSNRVREWSSGEEADSIRPALIRLNRELDQRAGTGFSPKAPSPENGPILWSAQQAYVDYSLPVVSKLEALDAVSGLGQTFFGLVGYDFFGSDGLISQFRLPNTLPNIKGDLVAIRIHPGRWKHKHKDMRFRPSPGEKGLADLRANLMGVLKSAFKHLGDRLSADQRSEAYRRLGGLLDDYVYAGEHASSVADFNIIWSVRIFRRLGYETLISPVGVLLDQPESAGIVSQTLAETIRENKLFIESINEIVHQAEGCDLRIGPKEEGYTPLFITDSASGKRSPLMCRKAGKEYFLSPAKGGGFEVNIGPAADEDVLEFLHKHKGRWSPNIFLPMFLFRLGLGGWISGRSSVKYSAVVGHVLERLFGQKPPPNLLCSATVAPAGELHNAVSILKGELPEEVSQCPPGLVYRMLFEDKDKVRSELAKLLNG